MKLREGEIAAAREGDLFRPERSAHFFFFVFLLRTMNSIAAMETGLVKDQGAMTRMIRWRWMNCPSLFLRVRTDEARLAKGATRATDSGREGEGQGVLDSPFLVGASSIDREEGMIGCSPATGAG